MNFFSFIDLTSIGTLSKISLVIFMFGVGLGLTLIDFLGLRQNPRAVLIGLALQMISLPLLGWIIATTIAPNHEAAIGLMIIASCPGGPSSAMFAWLARGDLPLSIALTAVNSVLAVMTMPFVVGLSLKLFPITASGGQNLDLPFWPAVQQITALVLFPLGCGMIVRRWHSTRAKRLEGLCKAIGLVMLLILVGILIRDNFSQATSSIPSLGAVILLLGGSMGLAHVVSQLSALPAATCKTIVLEVAIHNAVQGITIAASPTLLGRPDLAFFSTMYAVLMYPAAYGYTLWVKSWQNQADK